MMPEALAHEGKVNIPRLIPPVPEAVTASLPTFVEHLHTRINPGKGGETDKVLRFDFVNSKSGGLNTRFADRVQLFWVCGRRYGAVVLGRVNLLPVGLSIESAHLLFPPLEMHASRQ
jgi:hypothetical protein